MYERDVADIATHLAGLKAPLVGVDGPGASGKSTFAWELAERLGAVVIEGDDFHLPSGERTDEVGGDYDWPRLEAQVLVPLREGRAARYRRYDWPSDALAEWRAVPTGQPVVLEGVYVLRRELRGYYDYRIWIEADREVRLRRGLARDGEAARGRWMEWMRREDEYVAAHDPAGAADRRIAGEPESIDLREVFARPWEGEATLWRPWWLRWLPAPATFRFRSEIANETADSWDVIDTTTLPDGSVEVRRMRARLLKPGRMRLTAGDMPGGAEVRARSDGFDFTPYVIRTRVAGRLRVPLRYFDSVTLTDDGDMVDTIELRALGIRVARITMRLPSARDPRRAHHDAAAT